MPDKMYYCEKCNKTMADIQFYSSNNLEKYPEGKLHICKKCASMHIDNWNPETYLWILQAFRLQLAVSDQTAGNSIPADIDNPPDYHEYHTHHHFNDCYLGEPDLIREIHRTNLYPARQHDGRLLW